MKMVSPTYHMTQCVRARPAGLALTAAHEADPSALLGINDARFESDVGFGSSGAYLGERGRSVYNLTKALLGQSVSHGVLQPQLG